MHKKCLAHQENVEWILSMPYIPHYPQWPHSAAWHSYTYLSELSSNEAIFYPFLCTPTNFHWTYSTAFVTLFRVHALFIRLKAPWGPRLIYYYLMGLSTWQILNKCALNWTHNCWGNSWTHGSTFGIVLFQNKNSYLQTLYDLTI